MAAVLLRIERVLVVIEEAAVFVILAALLATLSLQIASRFLFQFPLDWTEELGFFLRYLNSAALCPSGIKSR